MIDNILNALFTAFVSIIILSGSGFILWWGIESAKRICGDSNCCKDSKKKPKK